VFRDPDPSGGYYRTSFTVTGNEVVRSDALPDVAVSPGMLLLA